jgi:hypothetical protein
LSIRDEAVVKLLRAAQLEKGKPPDDPTIPRFGCVIDRSELVAEGGKQRAEIHTLLMRSGFQVAD